MSLEKGFNTIKKPKEKMDGLMGELAQRVNGEFGEEILNSDASVNSEEFKDVYDLEEMKDDELMIKNKQLMWSAATNENTQKFYQETYNFTEDGEALTEKIVAKYLENRDSSKPALLEKAVVVVFHKILGDKFLVVRSSVHDDYENGIDNMIINKETGEVVCTFDEVHGEAKYGGEDRKREKIRKKAQAGGAKIKHGLSVKKNSSGKNELVKGPIKNVPAFFLSLEPAKLDELLISMGNNLNDPPSAVELEFFDLFIQSLEEQTNFLNNERIPSQVKINIDNFKKSLVEIKNLRSRFN